MRGEPVHAHSAQLDDNFRSHADILAFVRAICGREGYFSEDFLDLKAARTGFSYQGKEPRVDVLMTVLTDGANAEAGRMAQAEGIARRFDELRRAGHSEGDMVLLLGTMSNAHIYAWALREAGFSTIITGGSGFFKASELSLIVHLLNVLANPENTEALYPVLQSELFTLSDDELLSLATEESDGREKQVNFGHSLFASPDHAGQEGVDPVTPPSSRLNFARQVLQKAWNNVGGRHPSDVLLDVLIDSGWFLRLEGQGIEGQAVAGNLLKALRLVEDIQSECGFDMAQTAWKFSRLTGDKETPGALIVSNQDAVRIMTIHASKGLEFPIVAVAECYETRVKDEKLLVLKDRDRGFLSLLPDDSAVKSPVDKKVYDHLPPVEDPQIEAASSQLEFRNALLQNIKLDDLSERKRLLYVALTRASETVLVSMHAKTNKDDQLKLEALHPLIAEALFPDGVFPREDRLVEYGGSQPLQYRCQVVSKEMLSEPDVMGQQAKEAEVGLILEVRSDEQPDLFLVKQQDVLVSYTSLSAGSAASIQSNPVAQIADADKATDFGSAFHRLAQLAELTSPKQAMGKIESIAKTNAITDRARLSKAAENWFKSEAYHDTKAYPVRIPEAAFNVSLGPLVLEGQIDLLCLGGQQGQALVIDYKTGGLPTETPEELYDKHLLQAQCYAYALLNSGYTKIDLSFVRVEQTGQSGEIQTVNYSMSTEDLEYLEKTILIFH
ncbi:MAG: PD-(D/E)XK nuclease family protein, partial [Coriobacteriales bacterium]|jgi:ATP-dependent exoDNAse (exonuclease V) beta subunit|nr:PD-(D/E)XK nuclease family protein [Coriobacteriales bacterium]